MLCGSNWSLRVEKKTPRSRPGHHPSFSLFPRPSHNITSLSYCASSTHPLLVDTLLRFESLRVAGVLDFCHWESAASVLALRLSSGMLEISLQPNARALVKSSRSSDVTAQAHPQPARSLRSVGDEVAAPPTTNNRCYYHLPKAIHQCILNCCCGATSGPSPTSRSHCRRILHITSWSLMSALAMVLIHHFVHAIVDCTGSCH